MSDKSHLHRVFGLLAVAIVLGAIGQRLLQPESFGQDGHYRADSIAEIMSREPVHQGRKVCAECHPEIHKTHQKDVHWRVQCEDCHGPGDAHVTYHRDGNAGAEKDQAVMPAEFTLEGCLFCHRKLAARPSSFAQVDPREHYAFLRVTDPTTRCVECHDPHEPLYLLEDITEARIHPIIFECDSCHSTPPEPDHKQVANHPTIFVCRDCHPSVVRDFPKHEHSFLRCTACHLFHSLDEISGRVSRAGAARFCLLCHESKPFKDPDQMPQIVYADHLEQMAPVMRRLPGPLLEDPSSCLQCHFDYIHDGTLIRRLQEQER